VSTDTADVSAAVPPRAEADADLVEAARREEGGCVVLRLGMSRFAVPMDSVAEVVGVPRLTRMPASPAWLAGVANWRGRVLPVLDLRILVGVERTPLASTARLVVLAQGPLEAGILADAVPGLVTRGEELEPTPATVPPAAASIIEGILHDDGPIAVLDAAAVLALRGQLPRAR
jgi:chemotaxis signal transduction protein